jgi:siroheme decarboxylase
MKLDPTNAKLLDRLQTSMPLAQRPFARIGHELGLSEAEVLERVRQLRYGTRAIIRQISAIFDSRALGYESCLVAAKVDESRIEQAAAEISRHPGVSHNYRRNHAYNLWYTVAVPPDSRLGLQRTVDLLHERSGAALTRLMPALKMFKIGVKFNLGENEAPFRSNDNHAHVRTPEFVVIDADKRIIRVLQQDLPLVAEPFAIWAQQADVSPEQLLGFAQRYLTSGIMRRFSAVLRHREAGFGANAMGAWVVPDEKQEEFGELAASFSAVSHCYLRPTYPDWPYSIFTMVHAKQPAECEAVLREISDAGGITNYTALYSTHEYKKVRVKYFAGDIEKWESEALDSTSSLLPKGVDHACSC